MVSRVERAKQFLPFDALKGLQEALKEKENELEHVDKVELSEEIINNISERLQMLEVGDFVVAKYYHNKMYNEINGKVKVVDKIKKKLVLESGVKINFSDILNIK